VEGFEEWYEGAGCVRPSRGVLRLGEVSGFGIVSYTLSSHYELLVAAAGLTIKQVMRMILERCQPVEAQVGLVN
jgi:hypothetical protein